MNNKLAVLVIRGGIYNQVLTDVVAKAARKSGLELAVAIETNGGEPAAGFRIMHFLNANYPTINVLVPTHSMSTGTLMALGADNIYMNQSSCMGPLDLQIEHPMDGSTISSLDIRDTALTVFGISKVLAKEFRNQGYIEFGLSKKDAAKLALDAAVDMVRPIVDKIDPYHLHSAHRSAGIGAHYATELLSTRMFKSNPRLASLISNHLATAYDAHNYAITFTEAKETLGLNVLDIADYPYWNLVELIYNKAPEDGVIYKEIDLPTEAAGQANKKPKTPQKSAATKGDKK